MTTDDQARQLHDRATRGEALAPEERTLLDEWYAREDREEGALLSRNASTSQATEALRSQVDAALARLSTEAQRIQSLAARNDALRQEVAELHRRLAQKLVTQSA